MMNPNIFTSFNYDYNGSPTITKKRAINGDYHFCLRYDSLDAKPFVVESGITEYQQFGNLSEAVAFYEELTGDTITGTPELIAFKAYVSALIF